MVTYCSGRVRRRCGVHGARGSDATVPARPALQAGWAYADGAGVGAGDDAVRGDEAPAGVGACGACGDATVGAGEAALPESGADPDDPRSVDRQVRGASRVGASGSENRAGGEDMATEAKAGVATTQVYEIYIKAPPEAIWEAITSPEWTVKYGYRGPVEYEL